MRTVRTRRRRRDETVEEANAPDETVEEDSFQIEVEENKRLDVLLSEAQSPPLKRRRGSVLGSGLKVSQTFQLEQETCTKNKIFA